MAEPTVKPSDAVVGRWKTNASCVAIGRADWNTSGYIITTRHQGYGVGTSVWFDDVEYIVAEQWYAPHGELYTADLRVCRLENTAANGGGKANLSEFVLWNDDTNEQGKEIVIGGYGKTRGTAGTNYYEWTGSDNTELHWGENSVDGYSWAPLSTTVRSDVLEIDFDGPTTTDAAIAQWDSGGGWFFQDEGQWVVAGLGAYVDYNGRSYYVPPNDDNLGIRVSSYAAWIDGLIEEHYEPSIPGDADLDNTVGILDYIIWANNYTGSGGTGKTWATADFNFDEAVDSADYTIWATNYGSTYSSIPVVVPEPLSSCLLSAGLLTIWRRRKIAGIAWKQYRTDVR
ncbi:MAG: hypothetical protein JXA11_08015 [Phycisphaerae bacterium]|nr:hypothetical protein [Phycisphaerae bacterium]